MDIILCKKCKNKIIAINLNNNIIMINESIPYNFTSFNYFWPLYCFECYTVIGELFYFYCKLCNKKRNFINPLFHSDYKEILTLIENNLKKHSCSNCKNKYLDYKKNLNHKTYKISYKLLNQNICV